MAKSGSGSGLTDKQEAFCREYLVDFNATAAYLRCGYKCSNRTAEQNGSKLLRNTKIQAYLEKIRNTAEKKSSITLQRVLEEYAKIGFSDVTDNLTFGPNGVTFKDSKELPKQVTGAVESVTSHVTVTTDDQGRETMSFKNSLKLHNKLQALNAIGTHLGMRENFNQARMTLRKYGLALVPDQDSSTGWRLEEHVLDTSDSTD